ncbi:MAG: PilN domain-containing protein [Syntrophobacteraceae bacterium]
MLEGIFKHRPSNLCVIYVEPHRIEVLRGHRRFRTWEIEPAEQFQVPESETAVDYLQLLNLKPKGKKGSALLLIVSSAFYSIHREHYPISLKDNLEDAINFDWQENLFHEHEQTLHFFGPPVPLNHYISVPIFSIQREIYDRFQQSINGAHFQTFAVMPSALLFRHFLGSALAPQDGHSIEILARILDESQLEVHRFYKGAYLDSVIVGESFGSLELFRENLRSYSNGNGEGEAAPHMNLVCLADECRGDENYGGQWAAEGFPVQVYKSDEYLVTGWVRRLLNQGAMHTFDTELLLRPWEVPRIVWPLIAVILFFAVYGFYQVHSTEQLTQVSKRLRVQSNQLETRWKPIEELQTRIAKFQEDQKTLSAFNNEGYPLLELLTFLTQLTPEDTWINYLSLRKGQLVLRGESKSAIKFLSELSKTDGMSDVKFASPVTRNPASDLERFNVQVQLDVDKMKKNFENLPTEQPEDPGRPPATPVAPRSTPEVKRAPAVEEPSEEVEEMSTSEDEFIVEDDLPPPEEEAQ